MPIWLINPRKPTRGQRRTKRNPAHPASYGAKYPLTYGEGIGHQFFKNVNPMPQLRSAAATTPAPTLDQRRLEESFMARVVHGGTTATAERKAMSGRYRRK